MTPTGARGLDGRVLFAVALVLLLAVAAWQWSVRAGRRDTATAETPPSPAGAPPAASPGSPTR